MSENISVAEVKAVRWVERILAPIIVAAVVALATCTSAAQNDLVLLQAEVSTITKVNGATKKAIVEIKEVQHKTLEAQHLLDLRVTKIQANQGNLKEDVQELKAQNMEIIRLLRSWGG
jgi:hypothetical protein